MPRRQRFPQFVLLPDAHHPKSTGSRKLKLDLCQEMKDSQFYRMRIALWYLPPEKE
jgi:hypothetical protein